MRGFFPGGEGTWWSSSAARFLEGLGESPVVVVVVVVLLVGGVGESWSA